MGPDGQDRTRREFEETALVHMQSIYNAALRLVRNKTEAVREGVKSSLDSCGMNHQSGQSLH